MLEPGRSVIADAGLVLTTVRNIKPLCDSGDIYFDIERENRLPDYRRLPPDVAPGEVLALLNAGAYSLAQMFPYNGGPLPAAVMIDEKGQSQLIHRCDAYEDLITSDCW